MELYPQLTVTKKQTVSTTTFLGYNHGTKIMDGEMYDMKNLSARSYPLLDQRQQRGIITPESGVNVLAISGRDHLIRILDRGGVSGVIEYNGYELSGVTVSKDSSMFPKKFVHMGAYTCIWPDKVYFNTAQLSDCGSMERLLTINGSGLTLTMCRGDGTDYDSAAIARADDAPSGPNNNDLWLDTSGLNDVLKQYSSALEEWVEVATTYVKITGNGVGHGLSQYDVVTISGLAGQSGTPSKITEQLTALNNDMIVYGAGENYLYVAGLITNSIGAGSSYTYHLAAQTVTISRIVPDLDYIVESNNRLWGCKYGIEGGKAVNEIRACKLGDFKNWKCFMGLASDSYTVSVGSDGPFTGAVALKNYPVFFKEDMIHRVGGNTPSSFTLQTTTARGVQQGSWMSAIVVNELVIYKSRTDVMSYDGSMPQSISQAFGGIVYKNARAGTVGGKYYISMEDSLNNWHLFVYDTRYGTWHKEDDLEVSYFAAVEDELYMLDTWNNLLYTANGTQGEAETDDIPWAAVFGLFGMDYKGHKYLSRFNLRMQMDEGAVAHMEIQYDHDGKWLDQGTIRGESTNTFMLPVIPRRCDHLQLKLYGTGRCRIYMMSREMEVGGDG